MKRVFVNFSNHPEDNWDNRQRKEAERYGRIEDIPFPNVAAEVDGTEINKLAQECVERIYNMDPSIVMCQGEYTLCFAVVKALKRKGITVVAACSERVSKEVDGKKVSEFHFVRFREYI